MADASNAADRTHTVNSGETLSDIAARYYGDPHQMGKIATANQLDNPDSLSAGTVLVIPE
ncbi:LysM peptidoglycan-binding domain-containing protein [Streptomyces sp. NPDC055897]